MSTYREKLKELLHVDDLRVIEEQQRMARLYGYVPAYGPNLPDLSLAAEQVGWLLKDFPGYPWKVQVGDGMLQCLNEALHGSYGFKELVRRLDNDGRVVRRYGAELLRRFRMPEKCRVDDVFSAKSDPRGNLVLI